MENFNNQVILRDSMADCWLRFDSPVEVVQTYQVDKVLDSLQYVEEAVNGRGLYAAGMIAYEAAPAFDPSLAVRSDEGFPLLWFGLYHQPLRIELPPAPQSAQPEATWLASVSPRGIPAGL